MEKHCLDSLVLFSLYRSRKWHNCSHTQDSDSNFFLITTWQPKGANSIDCLRKHPPDKHWTIQTMVPAQIKLFLDKTVSGRKERLYTEIPSLITYKNIREEFKWSFLTILIIRLSPKLQLNLLACLNSKKINTSAHWSARVKNKGKKTVSYLKVATFLGLWKPLTASPTS